MAVIAAAVVPHAPLLALGRAPVTAEAARSVLNALPTDAPWVLLSPHGSRTAVRTEAAGSLAAFGMAYEGVSATPDPTLVDSLADDIDKAAPDPADQAIVVPLMLLEQEPAVVPLTFAEVTGPSAVPFDVALSEAKRVAETLERVAGDRDIVVVASAHTAASLTRAAPLLDRPEGHELHAAVLDALRSGSGLEGIPAELWIAAGSCGGGPLWVLGRALRGRRFEVTSEEAPFGVGYVCALTTS